MSTAQLMQRAANAKNAGMGGGWTMDEMAQWNQMGQGNMISPQALNPYMSLFGEQSTQPTNAQSAQDWLSSLVPQQQMPIHSTQNYPQLNLGPNVRSMFQGFEQKE